jgi:hypothetical protein
VEKRELDDMIHLLNFITPNNRDNKSVINAFQNKIWNMNDSSCEFKILNELANDLDYYEPDSEIRKEDSSYYDDDILFNEIKTALDRILLIN